MSSNGGKSGEWVSEAWGGKKMWGHVVYFESR